MIVGLQDGDFNGRLRHLNLDLMKMSAYHKKKGDIVKLCHTFKPHLYLSYYYYKDYYGKIPRGVFTNKKIHYGGRLFAQEKYLPMKSEIEELIPDTAAYEALYPYCLSPRSERVLRGLINAQHARLSLDGQTIWNKFEKQLSNQKVWSLILYDYYIDQVEDAPAFLKDFGESGLFKRGVVRFKYPVKLFSYNNLDKWKDPVFSRQNRYRSVFNFSSEEFYELYQRRKEIPFFKKLTFAPTSAPRYDENDFLKNEIQNIYKQAIFFRQNGLFFPLSFRYEKISNDVRDLLELIYFLVNFNRKIPANCTAYEYAKTLPRTPIEYMYMKISKQRARELFLLVSRINPELFELFYTCRRVEYKGGDFIIERDG